MKAFYTRHPDERADTPSGPSRVPVREATPDGSIGRSPSRWHARIAVYDSLAAAPRTVDVEAPSEADLIEDVSVRTYSFASEAGGLLPYTVIREVCENLIHADFKEPVVSVLDSGNTVRIADQGPGIPDKDRARLPGFTTASRSMKKIIRGVGSGLPIVREYLVHSGGTLDIDDNLGSGTVVTVRAASSSSSEGAVSSAPLEVAARPEDARPAPPSFHPPLSTRQKQVLSLVLEIGEAGPTAISKELSIALSTAHRDLAYLEHNGLISSTESGKRVLTPEGSAYLDSLFSL